MAIDKARARAAAISNLVAALEAMGFDPPASYEPRDVVIGAIVDAVLDEIDDHAEVSATATGVDTGGGTAPVTGGID